jgi:hypothetical protein
MFNRLDEEQIAKGLPPRRESARTGPTFKTTGTARAEPDMPAALQQPGRTGDQIVRDGDDYIDSSSLAADRIFDDPVPDAADDGSYEIGGRRIDKDFEVRDVDDDGNIVTETFDDFMKSQKQSERALEIAQTCGIVLK